MSTLSNRHVLIVGDQCDKLSSIQTELESRSVEVSIALCDQVTSSFLEEHKIDLIILNHLHDEDICKEIIQVIKGDERDVAIPVFCLVDDSLSRIETVLSEGAADYLTVSEDSDSILRKIQAVFSEDDLFAGSSAIDLTPAEVEKTAEGLRVFVVEDDPLLRNLLSIRLDKSAFPHEFSSDGQEVLPIIQQFKPDIIILDLMLPGRSGFDVLKEVKEVDALKEIPVVVFSNKDGEADRKKAKELGAVDFYVKAMTDLSELMETIQALVKKN